MKKQFVTYEIALAIKELDFDEECLFHYDNGNIVSEDELLYHIRNGSSLFFNYNCNGSEIDFFNWDNEHIITVSAPLWQQVIDWLREKY